MSRCWKHHLMIKDLCWEFVDDEAFGRCLWSSKETESAEARCSQDHRINVTLAYLLNSGFDIAANRHNVQPNVAAGRPVEDLHGPSGRSGSNPHAIGKIIKSPSNEHVAGVFTGGYRDDFQIICRRSREVLERVHRDIDLVSVQGIAYGADKYPSAADLSEVAVIDITGRSNAGKA